MHLNFSVFIVKLTLCNQFPIVNSMTDSDEDGFEDSCGVNLTGFLFGNIDESGNLESDVFDPESQKQLASLGRYVCLQPQTHSILL